MNVRFTPHTLLSGVHPEPMYKDFFDPPPRSQPARVKQSVIPAAPKENGRVRFHDEVRVKNIKSRGKGLPVNIMSLLSPRAQTLAAAVANDDEEYAGFTMNRDDIDDEGSEDDVALDEDDEDEGSFGSDVEMEEGSELDEDGQDTMERFKDDLFAEDKDESDAGEACVVSYPATT